MHDLCRLGTAHFSRERLYDPRYSPYLSLADYFAFLKLKMELKRDRYATISDIQTSIMTKLKTIRVTDFLQAVHWLEDSANLCVVVNGDYFE